MWLVAGERRFPCPLTPFPPLLMPMVMALTSSALNASDVAAMLSSACAGDFVPGIGSIAGEMASSQERATRWGVTPCLAEIVAIAGLPSTWWSAVPTG